MSENVDLWKPVADRQKYCSPACGFGCTHAAYVRATREGDLLAERLGPGWTNEVWENMGWHFSAHKHCCRIAPQCEGSTIAGSYVVTGYMGWFNSGAKQIIGETRPDPKEALVDVLEKVHAHIKKIEADLVEVTL